MIKTPVLLLLFNRPEHTIRVFDVIRRAQPASLYIAADGPRENMRGEKEKCEQVRQIVSKINWDCAVKTLFRDNNLGCRKGVSSAVDWFFNDVSEGIVLEDDCLPAQSFFSFCGELLDRYRDDSRVMQICGANFHKGWRRTEDSYYFSNYGPVWGWASWRRAWKCYDVDMKKWPKIKENDVLRDICMSVEEMEYRTSLYNKLYAGEIDTWDYQWGFAKMVNSSMSIIPNVNLISNIGFDDHSTHTKEKTFLADLKVEEITFPLKHPDYLVRDKVADEKYNRTYLTKSRARASAYNIIKGFIRRLRKDDSGKALVT